MTIKQQISGLVFLLLALTVGVMIWLTNWQMTSHFQAYLSAVGASSGHMMLPGGELGTHEITYLSSVHEGLAWVGIGLLLLGLAASYALAQRIAEPIHKLAIAVAAIKEGKYGQTVPPTHSSELTVLSEAFNSMSERLATNEKLRRRLLADIAHELRTPVTVIQGNLEGLAEGIVEPTKEQFLSLHEEAVHLSRLITDLRDLSLADAGHLPLERTAVSLLQAAQKCIVLLSPIAEERKLSIAVQGPEGLITADSGRIMQVFRNLLTNAIRYASSKVEITIQETPGEVSVLVADDGEGILAEHLPYIFGQFYRANEARDRQSGGSGIGLAIVKSLVEAHGGTIQVASIQGKGTVFTLRFSSSQ